MTYCDNCNGNNPDCLHCYNDETDYEELELLLVETGVQTN